MYIILFCYSYILNLFSKSKVWVLKRQRNLFVQSNDFNQITSYVIGQTFLVWP
jgi:hypothetical protein